MPLETPVSSQPGASSILDAQLKSWIDGCGEDPACHVEGVNAFLTECLGEAGFQRVLVQGGSYRTDDGGRAEELAEAMNDCQQRAFDMLPPAPEPTPEYLSRYFDFLLNLSSCIEDEGYNVAAPPSKDAFEESQGAIWHPYEAMDYLTEEEFASLERTCPQDFRG